MIAVQPQVVGDRYDLLEPIGAGGMGQVFAGFDRHLKRRIAVKFTQPNLDNDPGWTKRFFREAELMARMSHPGLPVIHDAGVSPGGRPYLVMEFVEGITFDDLLANHGSLPVGVVAALGAQTSAVLAAAHRHRIYHRDLKPSNLMLCPDGTVKVLDFGLAVVLDDDVSRYTSTGNTLGTPAFMAPEQVEGKDVVPQTDLYALGLVLHELLTGQRVMTGGTPFVVWQNQIHQPAPELAAADIDVPRDMIELVMMMLAKSPSQRPSDAATVHAGLLPHAAGLGDLPEVNRLDGSAVMYAQAVGVSAAPGPAGSIQLGDGRIGLRDAMEQTRMVTLDAPHEAAVERLTTVIDKVAPVLGTQDREVVEARIQLADLRFDAGEHRIAADLYRDLIDELTPQRGPYNDQVMYCQRRLARCEAAAGDAPAAVRRLKRLHTQMAVRYGEQDRRVIELAAQIRGIATG
ncbi:serine/threonine-protein kinase [Nocardia sp. NPDC023988]|uniref:serine/threonine-protein kinase n=1 Tax=Nocardia sp. NPDC023988 TaxID=3155361 RepID=UPI0033FFAED3